MITSRVARWRAAWPDLLAILLLAALCWLCFWRLLTPDPANQQSFVDGDFTGQFVSFAHYQAERLARGEVPLWNPYNLGGHPFLADTQSAVFYPPRLLTIAALNLTGGSTPARMLDALQREVIAHTFLASLLMYAFVRLTLRGQPFRVEAALIGAITFAYGGYLSGYPQLQVAVIEAGVWLPLSLLGVQFALPTAPSDRRVRWLGVGVAGIALGLSLLAGHPQTTLFLLYVALAYLCWCVYSGRYSLRTLFITVVLFALIGGGLAAVQVLPGLEYLTLTTRSNLTFEAKSNGFPFYDLAQVLLPGILSLWSPLFVGVSGLLLVIAALFRLDSLPQLTVGESDTAVPFWAVLALVALLLSFGRGTIVYDLVHTIVPGAALFRGQERSAYIIALCCSLLAAYGAQTILRGAISPRFRLALFGVVTLTSGLFAALLIHHLAAPAADPKLLSVAAFSALIACLSAWVLFPRSTPALQPPPSPSWVAGALVALVIFDLFSVSRSNPNLINQPASARLAPGFGVAALQAETRKAAAAPFRVDTIRENFGTLYGVMDVGGISPLKLVTVERVLSLPPRVRWSVLATRYVITADTDLPVPSRIVAQIDDPYNPFKLHELASPRPFARLVYRAWIEPNVAAAAGLMSDPAFDLAGTVMLHGAPGVALPTSPLANGGSVQIEAFTPEYVRLRVETPSAALVVLSVVNFPGWEATIDGQPAAILTADLALMAIPIAEAGEQTVELYFRPRSTLFGAVGSLGMVLLLVVGSIVTYLSLNRK